MTDLATSNDNAALRAQLLAAIEAAAELSASNEPYVMELLRSPRRRAERVNALLPGAGPA